MELQNIFIKTRISQFYDLDEVGQFILIRGFVNYIVNLKKDIKIRALFIPFEYIILGLIGLFRKNQYNKYFNNKYDIIIINVGFVINRLRGLKENYLPTNFNVLEFSINNNFVIKRELPENYLPPILPSIDFLIKATFFYLIATIDYLKYFSKLENIKVNYFDFISFFCKQLFHQEWAEKQYQTFFSQIDINLFIFDQDGYGQTLFLTNILKKNNKKTIHLQHGILTDAISYIPFCEFMFCCSQREKEELIKVGVNKDKLFVIGAPFQTQIPANLASDDSIAVEFLILASSEKFFTDYYIQSINDSEIFKSTTSKALRLRPGDTDEEKNIWRKNLNNFIFRDNISIFDEIYNANIIITFSYDALIKCLYLKKKVICFIHPTRINEPQYSFLTKISFLFIATSVQELDSRIKELIAISNTAYETSINYEELEYNFGTQNKEKIVESFQTSINKIVEL